MTSGFVVDATPARAELRSVSTTSGAPFVMHQTHGQTVMVMLSAKSLDFLHLVST